MNFILLIVGLLLILGGANYLTDGSAALAKRFNISEFIIGLTIVAVGTSAPELVVSVFSALNGSTAMAIGNVVGSNIFNTYVILGICALFAPIALTDRNMKVDIPLGILISTVLLIVCLSGLIARSYGVVMLLIYIAIMLMQIKASRREMSQNKGVEPKGESQVKEAPLYLSLIMLAGGLGTLIYGGNIFLDNAVAIAKQYGISDNVIAITLLAGGTSMPELAASVVSLVKGKSDIALGNIIGSNIANILLVLGATSTIIPLGMGSITNIDILVVLLGSILIYIFGFIRPKKQISRAEGAVLLLGFVGYMWWLLF